MCFLIIIFEVSKFLKNLHVKLSTQLSLTCFQNCEWSCSSVSDNVEDSSVYSRVMYPLPGVLRQQSCWLTPVQPFHLSLHSSLAFPSIPLSPPAHPI